MSLNINTYRWIKSHVEGSWKMISLSKNINETGEIETDVQTFGTERTRTSYQYKILLGK